MRNNQEDVLKDVNKSIQTYDKCHTFTNLFIYLKKIFPLFSSSKVIIHEPRMFRNMALHF